MTIGVKLADDSDVVATIYSLDQKLEDKPDSPLLKERLLKDWDRKKSLLPYPVASPVSAMVMIETSDDKLLIRIHPNEPGIWDSLIYGVFEPSCDQPDGELKSLPGEAVRDQAKDLYSVRIEPARIEWMAFGVGLESGATSLIGHVQVPETADSLRATIAQRARYKPQIEFLEMELEHVTRFLADHKARPFLKLGLHLCLWREFPEQVELEASLPSP